MRTNIHSNAESLPVDLKRLVIGYLGDDQTSLKSCSLVCHAWTSVAYSYLFRSMDVRSLASECHFATFIKRLQTNFEHVRAHIQDLALRCDTLRSSFYHADPEIVDVLTIHSVVLLLPNLRNLTLDGVSLESRRDNGDDFPLASLPHLHSLHIVGCGVDWHAEDITLALDAWFLEHGPPTHAGVISHSALADGDSIPRSIRGALQYLRLTWASWDEVDEYQGVIEDAMLTLKRLELEPKDIFWEREDMNDVTRWHELGLTGCTHLESLCLHLNYSHHSYVTNEHTLFFAALTAYTHILARHPPRSLRYLTLHIPIYLSEGSKDVTQGDSAEALWDGLDTAISQISGLASVSVVFRSQGPPEEAFEDTLSLGFQRVLTRADAKGILTVRYQGVLEIDPSDCPLVPLAPGPWQALPYTGGEQ
ncbi:hypothetical protein BC628DRAFT_1340984 [Trametes gibbosa]|nr:hypothetical protein BC628DRAFT_1340984 [Trametes gibbosa]